MFLLNCYNYLYFILQVTQRCRRHHCKRWSSSMSTFSGDGSDQKQTSIKPSYDESGKMSIHYVFYD